ncbi:class I SAM-dependent methyltransferase [Methylomonas sp. UP202]|uniref:class I SAM-dependent methyltransferase n=1 Tax=Methylomonas sp. UP202 TaxID=3040943 RepID=UPI00247859FE|nr:class I SAM-dependent methyltransferase [Methylomonas sp. UP202]WGS83996.1 class I SAM-dependent methyltransferase [Methylomonas sp. UP202]
MAFTLDKVVPWGRSYAEYIGMFGLTETDLGKHILGCGDGPAGFNAELTQRSGHIVSVDPVYIFDVGQIKNRIAETYETVMAQTRENQNDFIWDVIPSIEALGEIRIAAMDTFLADFELGKQQGRYVAGELPTLPFANGKFDIALSSHFLFLYSGHLSAEFHLQSIQEMLRVASEVRVFPLLTLDGSISPYLSLVSEEFASRGFDVQINKVDYEFQRGGNQMLVIKPK